MNHFSSSLTKLCEDSIPTGPRDYINKDSKLAYKNAIIRILKDAAGIPRNTEFDPKFISYERLMVRSKLQLADLVHQLCWFLSAKAGPIVEVAWRQMQAMQGEAEKKREEASVRERDEVMRLQGLLLECQREMNELQKKILSDVIQKSADEKGEEKPPPSSSHTKSPSSTKSPSPTKSPSSTKSPRNSPSSQTPGGVPRNSPDSKTTPNDRSQNLIIYGVREVEKESDAICKEAALKILSHTGIDPNIVSVMRLGEPPPPSPLVTTPQQSDPGATYHRPIRLVLQSRQVVKCILERSSKLRSVEGYERVYLCPDRTVGEREKRRKLVRVLGERREREPGKRWVIRGGEVVSDKAD